MAKPEPKQSESFFLSKEVFESIYRSHWKMVFGVCFRYLKDEELATELVQDIFESLWKRRESLQIRESIEQYLAGAARLAVFNFLRDVAQKPELLSLYDINSQVATRCTEEEIVFNDLSESVTALTVSLPEKSRKVFELSRNQGLSNKEIAAALVVSENTVKYHIAFALKFFKTGLGEFTSKLS